jgi:hypothetical protein
MSAKTVHVWSRARWWKALWTWVWLTDLPLGRYAPWVLAQSLGQAGHRVDPNRADSRR